MLSMSEDHKIIPGQEEIRSQIKRCLITLKKLYNVLHTSKPPSMEPERAFSATVLFVTKLRYRLNDKDVV